MSQGAPRSRFIALWTALVALKFALAALLPVFADEAWYWLESRHPAWAYSDLPGATAWLIGLGTALAGNTPLGLRWPFVAMAALSSWLLVGIARRLGDPSGGWNGAAIALAIPLFASLGVMALPDVPLVLAALLCFQALLRLRVGMDRLAVGELAAGLVLGALTHHRFVLLLGAGALALLVDPALRARLRWPPVIAALVAGVLAWWPVLAFERTHDAAALRFQFLERHPWSFQPEALMQPLEQAVVVTPLLYGLLLWTLWQCWRRRQAPDAPWRFVLAGCGTLLAGFFLAGMLADRERVGFHWPLVAYLPLAALLPRVLPKVPRRLAAAALGLAAAGCVLLFAYLAATASSPGRQALARAGAYPDNFSGWVEAATASELALMMMPPDTLLVADNFKLAAQLALALDGGRRVYAMDHRLNVDHGRAAQLRIWGIDDDAVEASGAAPKLIVVEVTATSVRWREPWYRSICARVDGWRRLRALEVDGGAKRFEWFAAPADSGCDVPAALPSGKH
ncbi:MAG TPA: glycosyltransferase family 39 protein [Xanthomonadaceae bacterium]|nr:glycosyltransferase family 39 protein [Xanthomonadaceae bacterium]